MIEVLISQEMKKRAWRKARDMGVIRNSILKGAGNIAGFLGEEVANQLIQGAINNTYDFDISYSNKSDTVTYDVKTKRCTSPPKPFYDCSIAAYNTKQKCDRYAFVRIEWVNRKWGHAWILGWLSHDEYFEKARKLQKGDVDPSNGYIVKATCYNVKISELREFRRRK
jgi:hypothetical protein